MAIREQVPKSLREPVGFASLVVMLFGVVVGYVLVTTGVTLFFGLQPFEKSAVSTGEAVAVTVIGLASVVVGYGGWRGFTYFAY